MNGRVYDPKLGRMLSPDPVTQAPENGQNYNRYTYANNNPLKYTDPSGYEFGDGQSSGGAEEGGSTGDAIYFIAAILDSVSGLFSYDSCDRTCKERHAALNWCKAQRGCSDELYKNTKKKFRRRSAQVIQEASETGQSYYYEKGRAHLGDQILGGSPSDTAPIVGGEQPQVDYIYDPGINPSYLVEGALFLPWRVGAQATTKLMDLILGRASASFINGAFRAGQYSYTKTALGHWTTRPYMKSPLLIDELIATGKGVADPGGLPGALRYDVAGTFNSSRGAWELVINPKTNKIYHFLFKSSK